MWNLTPLRGRFPQSRIQHFDISVYTGGHLISTHNPSLFWFWKPFLVFFFFFFYQYKKFNLLFFSWTKDQLYSMSVITQWQFSGNTSESGESVSATTLDVLIFNMHKCSQLENCTLHLMSRKLWRLNMNSVLRWGVFLFCFVALKQMLPTFIAVNVHLFHDIGSRTHCLRQLPETIRLWSTSLLNIINSSVVMPKYTSSARTHPLVVLLLLLLPILFIFM